LGNTIGKQILVARGVGVCMGNQSKPGEERLRKMYCTGGMTLDEMADELGVVKSTVSRWLEEHGIDRRNPGVRPGSVSLTMHRDGYPRWKVKIDGESHRVRVHQLLAVAEYGFDAVADNVIHHKNGIPWDNRPDNIDVVSRADHMDKHRHEWEDRRIQRVKETMAGESNHQSKITASDAADIRRRAQNGEDYDNIAADYPITPSHARNIVNGGAW
jgi:transposase-like protein